MTVAPLYLVRLRRVVDELRVSALTHPTHAAAANAMSGVVQQSPATDAGIDDALGALIAATTDAATRDLVRAARARVRHDNTSIAVWGNDMANARICAAEHQRSA